MIGSISLPPPQFGDRSRAGFAATHCRPGRGKGDARPVDRARDEAIRAKDELVGLQEKHAAAHIARQVYESMAAAARQKIVRP